MCLYYNVPRLYLACQGLAALGGDGPATSRLHDNYIHCCPVHSRLETNPICLTQ